jgi:hypothetical protein
MRAPWQSTSHRADLAFYVPSLMAEDVPHGWSADKYVVEVESGKTTNVSMSTAASLESFLGGSQRVMVVVGEPGVGKSSFLYSTGLAIAQHARSTSRGVAVGGLSEDCNVPWIPVLIDLKHYRTSELLGLIPRFLANAGLRLEDTEHLRLLSLESAAGSHFGDGTAPCMPLRLLVLCDGLDELQGESDASQEQRARETLRDLLTTLLGGPALLWGHGAVKLVVTTRESRLASRREETALFGPSHLRRLMLPFNVRQVCGLTLWAERAVALLQVFPKPPSPLPVFRFPGASICCIEMCCAPPSLLSRHEVQ